MSAVLNILRKDLRRIWPQVCLWFAAALLYYTFGLRISTQESVGFNPNLYLFLYWVSWISLFPSLVQCDAAVGDREFWMTRPISWRSLFAAKLTAAFLVGPVLAVTVYGIFLATQGFTMSEVREPFVWFAPLTLFAATGSLFLAAVTPSAMRFWFTLTTLLIGFLVFFVTVMLGSAAGKKSGFALGDVNVVLAVVLCLITAFALTMWQYRTRATRQTVLGASAVAAAILSLLVLRPLSGEVSLGARRSEKRDTLSLSSSQPSAYLVGETAQKRLALKVAVDALPSAPLFFDGGMIREADGLKDPTGAFVSGETVHIVPYLRELIGLDYRQLDAGSHEEDVWLQFPSITKEHALSGRLAGKIFGHRLRFDSIGRTPLIEGTRLALGSYRIQILVTPIGSQQHRLIVRYQSPSSRTERWASPVLVLVNSARKEWCLLKSDGVLSARSFALPGLIVGAAAWDFKGRSDRSAWVIGLDDDWLREAKLWVFSEIPDNAIEVPFTCELSPNFWSEALFPDNSKLTHRVAASEAKKF